MHEEKSLVVEPKDWAMIDAMMEKYPSEFAPTEHEFVRGFDRSKRISLVSSTAKKIENIAVQAEKFWSHEQGMINAEC